MFDVVTVGTATRDVFLRSELFRVFRDPKHLEKIGVTTGVAQCFALGSKIEVGAPIYEVGGGAANAAVTFQRQGFATAVVAEVGDDAAAEEIQRDLQKRGVRPFLVHNQRRGTAYSVILVADSGGRTILHYRGASHFLTYTQFPRRAFHAKWAYLAPGSIAADELMNICREFRKHGARLAINPSKHYLKLGKTRLNRLLRLMEVVIVNQEEASLLTGISYRDEARIFRAFDAIVGGIAVMTEGPAGVKVSDGKVIYRAGVFPEKKVVDRTGAGDAFGAGFVAGLLHGMKQQAQKTPSSFYNLEVIKFAITLASANATAVVEQIGAHTGALSFAQFHRGRRWKNFKVAAKKISEY